MIINIDDTIKKQEEEMEELKKSIEENEGRSIVHDISVLHFLLHFFI